MLKKLCLNNPVFILSAVIFLTPFQLPYADDDSLTVNIPNSQGQYTALDIKKSGNGFVGPKGEYYSEFPTVVQLQAVYDRGTSNSIVAAPAQSAVAQIEVDRQLKEQERIQRQQERKEKEAEKKQRQEIANQERIQEQARQQALQEAQAVQNVVPSVAQTIPAQIDQPSVVQGLPVQVAQAITPLVGQDNQSQEISPKQNILLHTIKSILGLIGGLIIIIFFLATLFISIHTCDQAFRGQAILFYNWPDAIGTVLFSIIMFLGFRQIYLNDGNYILGVVEVIGALVFNFYMSNKFYEGDHLQQIFINLSRVGVSIILPMVYLFCFRAKGFDPLHNQVKIFMNRVVYGYIILEWREAKKSVRVKQKSSNEILGVNVNDSLDKIKIAYKGLLMKYQPDRFAGLDAHIIDFVNEKVREINSAYANVIKTRGHVRKII